MRRVRAILATCALAAAHAEASVESRDEYVVSAQADASTHLWILVSLQRSGSTWLLGEIARSDCVRANGEIFDSWDGGISHDAAKDAWTPAGRRAAVEGLMKLADGAFDRFDGPVSHRLEKWTRRRFDKSSNNVKSVGFKWMVNQRIGEDYEWLLPLCKARGVRLIFLERSDLLKRAVSKVQNKVTSMAHARTELCGKHQ